MSFKPEYLLLPFVALMILGAFLDNTVLVILSFTTLIIMFRLKKNISDSEKSSTIQSATSIFNKHEIDTYHIGSDNLSCIGLDEKNNTIVFLSRTSINENFITSHLPFNDIFEAKLIEDDETVTQVSRASQLGGAITGGLIGGGIGAIVGGMGGKQHSSKEVRKISLELTVNNLSSPLHNVMFLNEEGYISIHDPKYKKQYSEANNWLKTMSVILKRNEMNNKQLS